MRIWPLSHQFFPLLWLICLQKSLDNSQTLFIAVNLEHLDAFGAVKLDLDGVLSAGRLLLDSRVLADLIFIFHVNLYCCVFV
jgi:hypothetical protein